MDTVNTFQTEINDKGTYQPRSELETSKSILITVEELAAKLDKLEQSSTERRGSENAAE